MRNTVKYFFIILTLWIAQQANAQSEQYAFLVRFYNKSATTFSLSNPQAYLSQRALDRRAKYNIDIDSTDLPVVQSYIDSMLHTTNGVLHLTSRWQNFAVILIPDSASILSLSGIDFVKDFKQVAYYPSGLHQLPAPGGDTGTGGKPTGFDEQYYGAAWKQIHLCNGEYLHSAGLRGNNKLIAVIDAGFNGVNTNMAFDSLFQQGRMLDAHNFILDIPDVYDYSDHGTKVLSCMASLIPETHVGTAPYASYVLYVTDDEGSEQLIEESNYVAATERADSIGADLITCSLGYNEFDNPADNHVYADLDGHSTIAAQAANSATAKGIVVVASAGNEGGNSWQYILTPGDADSAMTVGSVNASKIVAPTSGRGPNASGRLKPDVCGMGVLDYVIAPDESIVVASGTSYATPVIAGLTACLMQAMPGKTPYEIRSLIAAVSDSFNAPGYAVGNGVPDFKKALNNGTSIDDVPSKASAFKVFPNPAVSSVTIHAEGNIQYLLTDLQGRKLMEGKTVQGKTVSLSGLTKGIYLMKLNNSKAVETIKLLVE